MVLRYRNQEQKDELGGLLTLYGKMVFYNHVNLTRVNLAKAFSAFLLGITQGNWESYYYLSLFYFYGLDRFTDEKELLDFEKTNIFWDINEYLMTRSSRLSFLYLYTASLFGDERVANAIAHRYIKVSRVFEQ